MFWRKQKEINKLRNENNELEERLDKIIKEKEEHIKYLEKQRDKLSIENEKISNAIREYGNLEMKNINIPYYIEKREIETYEINNYGGGKIRRAIEKTKIIPQIIVHYVEYEEE